MSNPRFEYWEECISIALEEAGISATKEQIAMVAGEVESSHENYGMAFPAPSSPYPPEIKRLERELAFERDKIVCPSCKGSGEERSYGPIHMSISNCFKCRGEGKINPRAA